MGQEAGRIEDMEEEKLTEAMGGRAKWWTRSGRRTN
jgi:hypothetical protein